MTNSYEPGTYVKGDDVKVANTAARAVALAFDGYKLRTDGAPESATESESDSESVRTEETPVPSPDKPTAKPTVPVPTKPKA